MPGCFCIPGPSLPHVLSSNCNSNSGFIFVKGKCSFAMTKAKSILFLWSAEMQGPLSVALLLLAHSHMHHLILPSASLTCAFSMQCGFLKLKAQRVLEPSMKAGLWLQIPLVEWQPILGELSSTVGFIMLISDLLSLVHYC